MKRFHVHVAVPELDAGIRFYSALFGTQPTVRKDDYAKWMLDEPRLNFAISQRGGRAGVNHLGFQVDSGEELEALHATLEAADQSVVAERGANCCYARSDKYWVTDPAGIAWESFHTLDAIPMFGGTGETPDDTQCCTRDMTSANATVPPIPACCANAEGTSTGARSARGCRP